MAQRFCVSRLPFQRQAIKYRQKTEEEVCGLACVRVRVSMCANERVVCVCVCVCAHACVCACVYRGETERDRERERERERGGGGATGGMDGDR